jgi:hypothetical protein
MMIGSSMPQTVTLPPRRLAAPALDEPQQRCTLYGGQRVHRRHSSSSMHEDWNAGIAGGGKDPFDRRVVEPERLRPRVELDAACSSCQASLRLRDRLLARIEAAVGHDPSAAVGGPVENAVVRPAVGGAAVGIVEWERTPALLGQPRRESRPAPPG